jgi:hypothetical protein
MMQSLPEENLRVKQFPTVPTLDDWVSHSKIVPMAPNTEENHSDDAASSLGDSAYDFLDDRSTATTDDEGSANLTGSSSSSDRAEPDTPIMHQSQSSALASGPDNDADDKTEDEEGNQGLEGADWGIRFEESLSVSNNSTSCVEVSHTLRDLEAWEIGEVLPNMRRHALPMQLSLTIKQTMTGQTLELEGPLRLLFVGDVVAKDPIMQKLGSALAASSESSIAGSGGSMSRFNIVPIASFGEARSCSPEVLLVDSVGLEMSVQDCISASFSRKEDGNDSICLVLPDGMRVTSTWSSSQSRFAISGGPGGWKLPDVAIFYLSETDSMATKLTHRFAQSFMSRHQIPCLVVAQTQLPTNRADAISLDYMTPHLCLESSIPNQDRRNVVKRLPLDLPTFLELDARQLNRNLACLMKSRRAGRSPRPDPALLKSGYETSTDSEDNYGKTKYNFLSAAWLALKSNTYLTWDKQCMVLLFGIFLCLLLPSFLSSNFSRNIDAADSSARFNEEGMMKTTRVPEHKGPAAPPSVSTKPPAPRTLATTVSTSMLVHTHPSKGQSTVNSNTDLASFLLDSHALTPNNSAKFKVHVVGDCHIVLRPPHWFMRYRKAPKLLFNIMRQRTAVEHELLMLFDGVYALKVPREEAYGLVNVSVRTTSKPKINETFEIDFGNSWLKAAGWKRAAKRAAFAVTQELRGDLELAQIRLSTVYAHTSSELQVLVHEVVAKADAARKDIERIRSASLNHTLRTTDLVVAQTRDFSRNLSKSFSDNTSALSKQVVLYNHEVRKEVVLYLERTKAAFKHTGRSLSRSTPKLDLKRLATTAGSLRASHLRATQKNTLKAWWKIAGAPKQQVASSVQGRSATQSRPVSTKKQKGMR